MAEKNLIKIYVNATSAKRVDIIIRHYTDFIPTYQGMCNNVLNPKDMPYRIDYGFTVIAVCV